MSSRRSSPDTEFQCGTVQVRVVDDDAAMGEFTATAVAAELQAPAGAGPNILWLMAAPSAFPFYEAIIRHAGANAALRDALRAAHWYQFDDYPIARGSPQFPATFRHLLETRLYQPLAAVCGPLPNLHPLELTGGPADADVQRRYRDELLAWRRRGARLIQIKGTGMDGHWGFHGAESPLDQEPGMIVVPMNTQNVRQQMLDWPALFPTPAQVPRQAVTFNVPMFLLADRILDNTPQPQKEYAVLAAYGTDAVLNEVPSSALKRHPRAEAVLTRAAARALLEFRAGRARDPQFRLAPATHARLAALWRDPAAPDTEARNVALMDAVLRRLGMIG